MKSVSAICAQNPSVTQAYNPMMHISPETEELPASTKLSAPTPMKPVSMTPANDKLQYIKTLPNEHVIAMKPHAILPTTPLIIIIIIYSKASSGGATMNVYALPTGRPPGLLLNNPLKCFTRN